VSLESGDREERERDAGEDGRSSISEARELIRAKSAV
jgi:hypothetical protein